jgi:anti-sigma factor RsiW
MCDFQGNLIAWLDRELPEKEAAEVQNHVRGCEECRSQVEAYERLSREFDAYCDAAMSPRVHAKAPRWVRALSGAAAAAAVTAALLLMFPRARVEKPPVIEAPVAVVAPVVAPEAASASVAPVSIRRVHPRHVVTPAQTRAADWLPPEPTIEIAIPAAAMYPPGAVPEGMSFIVDVRLSGDGSAQQFSVRP